MKYVFVILLTFSLLYAYEWNPICEEDYSINGFIQNFEGNYPFILACDEGLLLKNGDDWMLESYGGLPVWDILLLGNGEFLLVQGEGSYSDGVYKFNENNLAFEVMEWIFKPNFLVYNFNQQEYYIGAYEGLFKSIDGENWEEVTYFSGLNCVELVFWQNHYVVSVPSYENSFYYSDNYGTTWLTSLLTTPLIIDMSFSYDSTLFGVFPAFSNSCGFWYSTDWGATWQIEFWDLTLSSVCDDMDGNTFIGWHGNPGVALWEDGNIIPMNIGIPTLNINKLVVNPVMSSIHIIALTYSGAYILTNYTNAESVLPKPEINLINHPNPFNPSTEISFQISRLCNQDFEIHIFNSKGQKVQVIRPSLCHPEPLEGRGRISVVWNGDDDNGNQVSSGVYLYKLVSNGKELAANKMLLLK